MVTIFQPVAVSSEDVVRHGCPYCNYRYNRPTQLGRDLRVCGNCLHGFAMTEPDTTESLVEYDTGPLLVQPHPRVNKVIWEGLGELSRPVQREESESILLTCYRAYDAMNVFSEAEVFFMSPLDEWIIGPVLDGLTLNEWVRRVDGLDPTQRYYTLSAIGKQEAGFLLSADQ